MWPTLKLGAAMRSSPVARPWTPPEDSTDPIPPQQYDMDPFTNNSDDLTNRWPLSPENSQTMQKSTRPDSLLSSRSASESYVSNPVAPFTPSKDLEPHGAHLGNVTPRTPLKVSNPQGPQYPYTPDSSRTSRTHALPSLSPLPPMPWSVGAESPQSPMQSALTSCMTHLENLIQTRQPNDDQMEYLVCKFEEMASFLSAPEAQSRQSDDHLFSEFDVPSSSPAGLGITSDNGEKMMSSDEKSLDQSYVLEVGEYIQGVKRYAEDLKMRMDEVKQLNSIQLDIIDDLRRELKTKSVEMKGEATAARTEAEQPKEAEDIVKEGPAVRIGFWPAVGEALDTVGDMWFEW